MFNERSWRWKATGGPASSRSGRGRRSTPRRPPTTTGWRATTRAGSTRSWPRRSPRRSPARRGRALLDLGCGTGALAELVLARVPGSRLSCVDLSPPHGRRRAGAARLARGGRGRRRGGAAVSRGVLRRRLVQRLLPPLPRPRPCGVLGMARAQAGRGVRRRGRLAARARPRPHERVDAAFPARATCASTRRARCARILGKWFDRGRLALGRADRVRLRRPEGAGRAPKGGASPGRCSVPETGTERPTAGRGPPRFGGRMVRSRRPGAARPRLPSEGRTTAAGQGGR